MTCQAVRVTRDEILTQCGQTLDQLPGVNHFRNGNVTGFHSRQDCARCAAVTARATARRAANRIRCLP